MALGYWEKLRGSRKKEEKLKKKKKCLNNNTLTRSEASLPLCHSNCSNYQLANWPAMTCCLLFFRRKFSQKNLFITCQRKPWCSPLPYWPRMITTQMNDCCKGKERKINATHHLELMKEVQQWCCRSVTDFNQHLQSGVGRRKWRRSLIKKTKAGTAAAERRKSIRTLACG